MASKISFIVAGALVAAFSSAAASAHISVERGSTHKSRYGDVEIKDGPCGRANGTRGTNVYTYTPGQTITIEVAEYIPHPSYYRIAFDADGDNDFKEPASIKPIDTARRCPINSIDKCGSSDFYNNASVLPNMDNLEPHLANAAKAKYTFQVKLPDVECTNCTLQIIQVMEDDAFHGPYNPERAADPGYIADIYHQCIDLVLTRGASGTGGTGAGGSSGASGASGSGAGAAGGAGGTGAAGGAGGSNGVGGAAGGAGGSSGGASGTGAGAAGGAGGVGAAGGAGGTSATGGAGGAQASPSTPSSDDESGCSCRVAGRSAGASWLLALGLAAGLLRRRARP